MCVCVCVCVCVKSISGMAEQVEQFDVLESAMIYVVFFLLQVQGDLAVFSQPGQQ